MDSLFLVYIWFASNKVCRTINTNEGFGNGIESIEYILIIDYLKTMSTVITYCFRLFAFKMRAAIFLVLVILYSGSLVFGRPLPQKKDNTTTNVAPPPIVAVSFFLLLNVLQEFEHEIMKNIFIVQ